MRAPFLLALAAGFLMAEAIAVRALQPVPLGAVRVHLDAVPPDACLELFGPSPCRPHGGAPTTGGTDAVAGPPPKGWRGEVR